MTESDANTSDTSGGAEPPDDGWPQLERRDWSTRPTDAQLAADRERPEHDTVSPATDLEAEPDEPTDGD